MIHIIKKIVYFVIILLFILFNINYGFSYNKTSVNYIQINPKSSSNDIKKTQLFFKKLKIYSGKIDGKFSSLKKDITSFQIKNGIISNKNSPEAGYIGKKTYSFFEKKYGEKFKKAYQNFFKIKKENYKKQKCFIVSAYYSPLPNQKRYSTKSYAGDIRLNGNGTHGASGAGVHPGFIAAPSNYPFGTKIKLEGLGVGVVEDRGGAIVRKGVRGHECDRLDIWMGYGDEGLNRALKWGKKKVNGEILNKNAKITITFPTEHRVYLAKKISPKSNKNDIKYMQDLFKKAQIYSGKIDGKYSSFKNSIIDFQIKNKIIKSRKNDAAGYIGPKTIKKLEEIYPEIFILIRREDLERDKKTTKANKIIPENKKGLIPKTKNNSDNKVFSLKEYNNIKILKKFNITKEEKTKLDIEAKRITEKLKKKSKNNSKIFKKLKNQFRNSLTKTIKNTKKIKLQNQLKYLKYILN